MPTVNILGAEEDNTMFTGTVILSAVFVNVCVVLRDTFTTPSCSSLNLLSFLQEKISNTKSK
jgi:hypothetical protein